MTENLNNVIEPQKFGEIDESLYERLFGRQLVSEVNCVEIFGPKLGDHIMKCAEASSCSIGYILLNFLTLSSSIIGNKRKILVHSVWSESTHLWGLLAGSPSSHKSSSMGVFRKGLEPLEEKRREEYKEEKKIYQDRANAIRREEKNNRQIADDRIASELKKPILRQLIVNDTTVEAIRKIIDPDNPECFCIWRDEFTGFIKSLEKFNNSDRTLFLEAYNSAPYTINRVSFDEPLIIPKLSISLLGGVQLEKLHSVLGGDDDGLASRFLFAQGDLLPWKLLDLDFQLNEEIFKNIFSKLNMLSPRLFEIPLSSETRNTFDEWGKDNQDETQRYASGLLGGSYGKFPGQLLRIACVLEHIFWAFEDEESPPPSEISNEAMEKAILLIEGYFKPMAHKVFYECLDSRNNKPWLKKVIESFIKEKMQVFNWRDAVTRGRIGYLSDIKKDEVIKTLTELNIIREMPKSSSSTGGRPKEDYEINQKIMEWKI